jgi:hypothetical protein
MSQKKINRPRRLFIKAASKFELCGATNGPDGFKSLRYSHQNVKLNVKRFTLSNMPKSV